MDDKEEIMTTTNRNPRDVSSAFSARRVNSSTFVVEENDAFGEHPLIYVKIHPEAPVIVLSDTGCDEPSEEKKSG